jgi:hypothetical protein
MRLLAGSLCVFSITFLVSACVTVPRQCAPLVAEGKSASYFTGKCRKLVYHDEDFTADCRGEALLFDSGDKSRTVVFFSEDPHELVAFSGVPFSVDPKSLRFDTGQSVRAPRSALGSQMEGAKEKGSCDFVVRDARSYLIRCQAKDEKGKLSSAEFATSETSSLYCRDDFPKPSRTGF